MTDHTTQAIRLTALRGELRNRGLDGFLVPRADEFQGEYVPPSAERLSWLTGFTGSAGFAAVLMDQAALFVDGRYTLQAAQQCNPELYEMRHVSQQPLATWLREHLEGRQLGYDPWLHTESQVRRLTTACERAGGLLVASPDNPLDAVWSDRPEPPLGEISLHPLAFAGRSTVEKYADVVANLREAGAEAAVLTQPDSLAWLLNVRGSDVPRTPLPLSFAIVYIPEAAPQEEGTSAPAGNREGRIEWFLDQRKLPEVLQADLDPRVVLRWQGELGEALGGLSARRILVDPDSAAAWVFDRLRGGEAQIVEGADPCALPKACKNPVELEGTRAAHRRDGVAVTRFLAWLETETARGAVTEMQATERLAALRAEQELFRDLSFDTISGSGPNGAIVHYRVTEESDRSLSQGELYLVDSGGQYLDGTTDVTRTIAIGAPSAEMRERYTRVLKGHVALALARFPAGTSGSQLDSLARRPLWEAGLDYDHGTGHGVGSYLSVHEGPQRISKLPNNVALRPGMIVSNEPGYYKTGAYGIRIENLVAVTEASPLSDGERPMHGFETLTLAPFDRHLIDPALLTSEERTWIDTYHARVRESLTPLLDAETAGWLEGATAPLVG
ncbi:aminopeptidase P family protein [Aquibaculum sediminis]|uniref:aminopeptidase P family protein n=1 Tax=Aquibaculum sediminis TaxID=3231907 RepID=UPI003454E554